VADFSRSPRGRWYRWGYRDCAPGSGQKSDPPTHRHSVLTPSYTSTAGWSGRW
jgi:hypothetical protein